MRICLGGSRQTKIIRKDRQRQALSLFLSAGKGAQSRSSPSGLSAGRCKGAHAELCLPLSLILSSSSVASQKLCSYIWPQGIFVWGVKQTNNIRKSCRAYKRQALRENVFVITSKLISYVELFLRNNKTQIVLLSRTTVRFLFALRSLIARLHGACALGSSPAWPSWPS